MPIASPQPNDFRRDGFLPSAARGRAATSPPRALAHDAALPRRPVFATRASTRATSDVREARYSRRCAPTSTTRTARASRLALGGTNDATRFGVTKDTLARAGISALYFVAEVRLGGADIISYGGDDIVR